jgi:hypothetical protein
VQNMIKTNLYLTAQQMTRIGDTMDKTGMSMAEVIRRAIDSFYGIGQSYKTKPAGEHRCASNRSVVVGKDQ